MTRTDRKSIHKPFAWSSCEVELLGCLFHYTNERIVLVLIDDISMWHLQEDRGLRSSQTLVGGKDKDYDHSHANFFHQLFRILQQTGQEVASFDFLNRRKGNSSSLCSDMGMNHFSYHLEPLAVRREDHLLVPSYPVSRSTSYEI